MAVFGSMTNCWTMLLTNDLIFLNWKNGVENDESMKILTSIFLFISKRKKKHKKKGRKLLIKYLPSDTSNYNHLHLKDFRHRIVHRQHRGRHHHTEVPQLLSKVRELK